LSVPVSTSDKETYNAIQRTDKPHSCLTSIHIGPADAAGQELLVGGVLRHVLPALGDVLILLLGAGLLVQGLLLQPQARGLAQRGELRALGGEGGVHPGFRQGIPGD